MRDLTLVVPACNEAQRIVGTLDRITTFLEGRRSFEVIVVDDGSIDGPLAVCRGFAAMHPSVRVISLPENEGKGCAVRLGHDAPLMLQQLFRSRRRASSVSWDASRVPRRASGT